MGENDTSAQGGFVWYELMTSDPAAAGQFYNSVVGWTFQSVGTQPSGVDYSMIMRDDGGANGGVLKLTADMTAHGARPCWLGYFYAADVDAAVAAITADGGKVLMPAHDIPYGRIAMVTDPQGAPFYVMKPTPPSGSPDAKSDVYDRYAVQHVSWNELATTDLDAGKAFYNRHFGFAFNQVMPMGEMGDYCFIDLGGEGIGALMKSPPGSPPPMWTYYIRVDDIDRAIAAVTAGGGKVLRGPHEVPGGDWTINGSDPQGAAFALVGAKNK